MGAQTMLWASDATWMKNTWTCIGLGKGLASFVVPVDDRDDSKTMLWD